jgi:5-methyltetrahydropteroyltriglutamate--homocysteine methyltransferase
MKRSTEQILTTHVGSLARPPELVSLLEAQKEGRVDLEEFDEACRQAVKLVVEQQAAAGISVISDGEQSKPSFSRTSVNAGPASATTKYRCP